MGIVLPTKKLQQIWGNYSAKIVEQTREYSGKKGALSGGADRQMEGHTGGAGMTFSVVHGGIFSASFSGDTPSKPSGTDLSLSLSCSVLLLMLMQRGKNAGWRFLQPSFLIIWLQRMGKKKVKKNCNKFTWFKDLSID